MRASVFNLIEDEDFAFAVKRVVERDAGTITNALTRVCRLVSFNAKTRTDFVPAERVWARDTVKESDRTFAFLRGFFEEKAIRDDDGSGNFAFFVFALPFVFPESVLEGYCCLSLFIVSADFCVEWAFSDLAEA